MNVEIPAIDDAAIEVLQSYPWPGNVRELQNVVQRFLFLQADVITRDLARRALNLGVGEEGSTADIVDRLWDPEHLRPWREIEEELQRDYFLFAREHTGSDAEAARALGLAPPNYHRMCKRLGIK